MDERALSWIHLLPHEATLRCWNVPTAMLNLLGNKQANQGAVWFGWEPRMRDVPALEDFRSVVLVKPHGVSASWLRAQGFQHIQTFAVVPHIGDARWFVSLRSKRAAVRAWDMYTPFRARTRVQKAAAMVLSASGLLQRVSDRIIVAQREPSPLADVFTRAVSVGAMSMSISSGTPSPRRKLTIQLVNGAGDVVAYAKYAEHANTAGILKQEAQVLACLQHTGLKTAQVPRLLGHGPHEDGYVMVTAPFAQQKTATERVLTERFMGVLRELATRTGSKRTGDVLQQWQQRVHALQHVVDAQWCKRLRTAIAAIAATEQVSQLPTAMAHGDFAPWNVGVDHQTQQLVVFDWEHSASDQLLLYDAFHFKTQVDMLVLEKEAAPSVQATLAEIAQSALVHDLELSSAQVHALYAGYLLDASMQWFEEQQKQNDAIRSDAEQAMRGKMLDVVLSTYLSS